MDQKQIAVRNKQRERQQRGDDFQEEILRSWRDVPNIWTINIKDGRGGTRPADRLVITEKVNILTELKRTASRKFELAYLRPNQIKGLRDFDEIIERNYGLVLVSFHNPSKGMDEAYAIRIVTAMRYMQIAGRNYINLNELRSGKTIGGKRIAIQIPRVPRLEPTYDLRGVAECSRYL